MGKHKMPKGFIAGASASLNLSITEIMDFLGHNDPRPGQELRSFLYEKIGDLGVNWYKKGFNRGHMESYAAYKENDEVPRVLRYECTRETFAGEVHELSLKSAIALKSKKVRKKIATPKTSSTAKSRNWR